MSPLKTTDQLIFFKNKILEELSSAGLYSVIQADVLSSLAQVNSHLLQQRAMQNP